MILFMARNDDDSLYLLCKVHVGGTTSLNTLITTAC